MLTTWIFYIFLTVITVVLFYCAKNCKEIRINFYNRRIASFGIPIIIFVILLFFAVFRTIRGTIGGTDAYTYLEMFRTADNDIVQYLQNFKLSELLNRGEPLFVIYNTILRSITDSTHVYLAVTYGIIVSGLIGFVSFFYKKKSYFFSLILLICAYLYSFNIMRSWISIVLCMWAFKGIINEKWKKAIILIILASLIHYMSFSFILVWLICYTYNKKPHLFSKTRLLLMALLSNVVCLLIHIPLKDYIMTTKYGYYEDLFGTAVSIWGYLPGILICIIAILLFEKKNNYLDDNFEDNKKKANIILALAVNLSLTYLIIFMYAWRINDYFMLIRMVAISILYEKVSKDNSYTILYKIGIYSFTSVLYFLQMLGLKESSGIFPYILSVFE